MSDSTTTTNVRRVYDLAFIAPLWGPLRVELTADCQGRLSARINEQPADVTEALTWLERARLAGYVELVCQSVPFAGKPAAHRLHVTLGELGFKRHYELAADALGRPVESLANLTTAELQLVSSFAYGQLGMVG